MEPIKEWNSILESPEIHEPTFSYFSNVYMTFLSIIQGVIFSISVGPFLKSVTYSDFNNTALFLPTLSFSILLWHNYVNHHQLIGWQLHHKDTYILITFGLLQTMAVSIPIILIEHADPNKNSYIVDLINKIGALNIIIVIILICAFLGFLAYNFSIRNAITPYVKKVFLKKHTEKTYLITIGVEEKLKKITLRSIFLLTIIITLLNTQNHYHIFPEKIHTLYFDILINYTTITAHLLFVTFLFLLQKYDIKRYIETQIQEEKVILLAEKIIKTQGR
ncbi:MAG: hypothetical protein FJY09_00830 [Chlorobi bacterium]|nr:hypothetical protein [Chlorobiota bacterium]